MESKPGRLASYNNKFSFLYLLKDRLKVSHVNRLNGQGKWISLG